MCINYIIEAGFIERKLKKNAADNNTIDKYYLLLRNMPPPQLIECKYIIYM